MKYTLKLIFILNLTIFCYPAEHSSISEHVIEALKKNSLSNFEKKILEEYMLYQIQALEILQEKRYVEKQISQEAYKKQKKEIKDLENKFFEAKNSATKLYNDIDENIKEIINIIMIMCLTQDTTNLCKIKLKEVINYIKKS
ncbi:MAG: hypothetical protein P4L22_06495 [Candidatus Babeliales bacterium]|nr:hypothetical protein [Candidatus Babeliales bacterium]